MCVTTSGTHGRWSIEATEESWWIFLRHPAVQSASKRLVATRSYQKSYVISRLCCAIAVTHAKVRPQFLLKVCLFLLFELYLFVPSGFVGEPEDFTSCMVLKCNHCPQSFCGFCYNYADNWTETHIHVRQCAQNSRENYFVESEEIWHNLMRQRRIGLAEAVLSSHTALTSVQIAFIREQYALLL